MLNYQGNILRGFCTLIFCTLLLTGMARAQDKFVYEVYAGGIHALQAVVEIDDANGEGGAFHANIDTHTRGILGTIAPWRGSFETDGGYKNGLYIPKNHKSIATWRGEDSIYTYTYEGGDLKTYTILDDENDGSPQDLEYDLVKNSTDILSATLTMMAAGWEKGSCTHSDEIFDGKRRFELAYQTQGKTTLPQSSYNLYSGPALECAVEVKPKGGKWREKPRGWMSIQEQGRKRGTLPTIWLAEVEGLNYLVPVKIRLKTAYGTLFIHLVEYKINGTHEFTKRAEKIL